MRIMRSNLDGSNVTVVVRNGVLPVDSRDVMRHCVGIAVEPVYRYIYWTQKGPPDGGKGASSAPALKFRRISNPRTARMLNY